MYGGGTSKPTTASTPMHITHLYDDNCKVCAQPRQIGKNNHYCYMIGQDTNTFNLLYLPFFIHFNMILSFRPLPWIPRTLLL